MKSHIHILAFVVIFPLLSCSTESGSSTRDKTDRSPQGIRVKSVLLKGPEAAAMSSACTYETTGKGLEMWLPSEAEIIEMESRLTEIRKLRVKHPKPDIAKELDLVDTYMQYAGVIANGRRLVCINAFRGAIERWREVAVVVEDGGIANWRAVYDPATKMFFNLMVNGEA